MCRGQPCTITRYTFTWSNKLITGATGSMPDPNNPGRTLTEDILKDLENTMLPNSESGFVLKRLRVKADEQARRKLGRRIEMGPGDGEITLVESGCGEEGTCQCIAVKGAEPVTLEPVAGRLRCRRGAVCRRVDVGPSAEHQPVDQIEELVWRPGARIIDREQQGQPARVRDPGRVGPLGDVDLDLPPRGPRGVLDGRADSDHRPAQLGTQPRSNIRRRS